MTSKILSMEPRVSALEASQEALHRDVMNLSNTVKEQGVHLAGAIEKLIDSHNSSFGQLSDKINAVGKTDWTTFWTMIMASLLILTAVSTPVWITFAAIDKVLVKQDGEVKELKDFAVASIRDRAELRVRIETNSDSIKKLERHAKRDLSSTK